MFHKLKEVWREIRGKRSRSVVQVYLVSPSIYPIPHRMRIYLFINFESSFAHEPVFEQS